MISWNGTSNSGGDVAAGMYIYSIQAGKFKSVKKNGFAKVISRRLIYSKVTFEYVILDTQFF